MGNKLQKLEQASHTLKTEERKKDKERNERITCTRVKASLNTCEFCVLVLVLVLLGGCSALAIEHPTVVRASIHVSRFTAGRLAGFTENIGASGMLSLSAVPTT